MTHAERCAGSSMPKAYVAKPGWSSQVGQYGGKPAVLIYRKEQLQGGFYIHDPERKALDEELLKSVPNWLRWQGKRRNFRVLGQIRQGRFEALAVLAPKGKTLISNLADSNVISSGLTTPSMAASLRRHNTKRIVRPTNISVITTVYSTKVVFVWYNRDKERLLKKVSFSK